MFYSFSPRDSFTARLQRHAADVRPGAQRLRWDAKGLGEFSRVAPNTPYTLQGF